MRTLFGQPVFTAGGQLYFWEAAAIVPERRQLDGVLHSKTVHGTPMRAARLNGRCSRLRRR